MSAAVVPPAAPPGPALPDRNPSASPRPSVSPPAHSSPVHKSPATTHPPKIAIKKEPPSSPSLPSGARHRPRKLDLSGVSASSLSSRGPLTARDGRAMQDVGLACLSPGFQTHDPARREQLQRSLNVREQQRSIIEARLQLTAKGDGSLEPAAATAAAPKQTESPPFSAHRAAKKRPPPGLSIVPPAASQFAHERIIQSAPLNHTFSSRRQTQPAARHFTTHHPVDLAASPHIPQPPAPQTNNRLPPLADVFGADALALRDREQPNSRGPFAPTSNQSQPSLNPLPSPGLPAHPAAAATRPREYRSAEEAVHDLSGGREEFLPRIIHYSDRQPSPRSPPAAANPPTTSSTHNHQVNGFAASNPAAGRRRTRQEYEQDHGSPPLGPGPEPRLRPGRGPSSYGPFGAGRDSPETQRLKKEEFLGLCARAWDLFHS
ncbi:hypothetical protein LOZ65_003897 [Ophidiomyces ophidiicola]|nr:hypothetical protein LOZ65_003897 [Ophidiomyces ophidiicola]